MRNSLGLPDRPTVENGSTEHGLLNLLDWAGRTVIVQASIRLVLLERYFSEYSTRINESVQLFDSVWAMDLQFRVCDAQQNRPATLLFAQSILECMLFGAGCSILLMLTTLSS